MQWEFEIDGFTVRADVWIVILAQDPEGNGQTAYRIVVRLTSPDTAADYRVSVRIPQPDLINEWEMLPAMQVSGSNGVGNWESTAWLPPTHVIPYVSKVGS